MKTPAQQAYSAAFSASIDEAFVLAQALHEKRSIANMLAPLAGEPVPWPDLPARKDKSEPAPRKAPAKAPPTRKDRPPTSKRPTGRQPVLCPCGMPARERNRTRHACPHGSKWSRPGGRFGRAGRTKAVKEEPRVERDASHDFTLTYDVRHPEVPTVRTPGAEGGYVLNQSPLPDPDAAGPFVFPVPASLRAAPADHMGVAPDPTRPQEWASTTDDLVGAGFLSRSPRGILVTPEGLAAILADPGPSLSALLLRGMPGDARLASGATVDEALASLPPAPEPKKKCRSCGHWGHWAKDCPTIAAGPGLAERQREERRLLDAELADAAGDAPSSPWDPETPAAESKMSEGEASAPAAESNVLPFTRDQMRSRRAHPVRALTISGKRTTRRQLEVLRSEPREEGERPRTRGDCEDGERPCPWVSCRYHLYLDVDDVHRSVKLNFPDLEPDQLKETCSLDVADRGGMTLDDVSALVNVSRERIRQVEERVKAKLEKRLRLVGITAEETFEEPRGFGDG